MKKEELKACFFRLPAHLKDQLDQYSQSNLVSKTKVITQALEMYFETCEDFCSAIEALEELKDGNYKKASKKIDDVIKKLTE